MSYRELLRIPGFRHLFIGQMISQLGDALYYLVFLFMVDKITGDAAMVGICGVAQALPFLLFSLYAGVLADRYDRRAIMLFADGASTVILLLFALLVLSDTQPPAWTLIAVSALLSTVNVLFAPAKSASIPSLVDTDALQAANSLSLATQNTLPLLGSALSGTVLAALFVIAPRWFFLASILLNALSFAASAFFIAKLPPLLPDRNTDSESHSIHHLLQETQNGLNYLRGQRVLLVKLILSLLFNFAIAPFMVVYILVNREWFGGGYATLALCEGSFFLGAILCGLFVGRMKIRYPGIAFIWGIALIGVTVMAMAYAKNILLFAFWNLAAGIGIPFSEIPMTTYIQSVVPDGFRGRVNASMGMANMGVQPLGIGIGGVLLKRLGAVVMLLGMGSGMAIGALVGLADRQFRRATLP